MSEDIKIEVIKSTQETLGKFIKKPPLTEKLLRKPPFRFLHDIVKEVYNSVFKIWHTKQFLKQT